MLRRAVKEYVAAEGLNISLEEQSGFEFGLGDFGKPYIRGRRDICFSISHSMRYWACLLHGEEVGLDIEYMGEDRKRRDFVRIARRFFAPDEIRLLEACDTPEAKERSFYSIWTRKEAYVKYSGRGMGQGLSAFSAVSPPADVAVGAVALAEPLMVSYCLGKDGKEHEIAMAVKRL
ncbi:MAG: 4'-phosphopantetheinyl transferase superfamily protein [Clostridiales Family XIII bacterium]|nr:4'-phosphopantetheinyl transferase superfamily protein [Clostridiales Family XIII bacterium]